MNSFNLLITLLISFLIRVLSKNWILLDSFFIFFLLYFLVFLFFFFCFFVFFMFPSFSVFIWDICFSSFSVFIWDISFSSFSIIIWDISFSPFSYLEHFIFSEEWFYIFIIFSSFNSKKWLFSPEIGKTLWEITVSSISPTINLSSSWERFSGK